MQSSIIDRIFPPSSPLLPQHDRRSSPSPTSTSSLPLRSARSPPISSSSVLRPAPVPVSLPNSSDPLLPIDRAAKSLQSTIQSLLDAQSEGLLAGLTSSNGQDDVSSNGSLTPTPTMSSTTTPPKPITIPVRQPKRRKITLRGARRGLSRSMHDFVTLKQEEERIVDTQIREREDALGRIEAFTSKKEAIQSQIDSINAEPVARSANRLRTEANELDIQIRELENQLFEMKTRHRHLMDQGQQLENSVQSKLSSYNASLELIHKDVKQFLARPPIAQSSSGTTHSSNNGTGVAESFYSLNPKRRTLEMANEHWREEREALERRKKSIQHEKTALEEGGKIWREVVTEVQTFEQNLKTHMQHLSKGSISQQERDEGMAIVLDSMNKIIEDVLERRLQEAEEKDWKLLICCVGAELEAFREGREMLVQASGLRMRGTAGERKQGDGLLDDGEFPPTPPAATATGSKEEDFFTQQHQDPLQEDDSKGTSTFDYGTGSVILSPISTGDGGTVPSRALSGKPTSSADSRSSESEDDDPGPDFLISHS